MTGDDLIVVAFCALLGYAIVWFALSLRKARFANGRSSDPDPEETTQMGDEPPDWYKVLDVPVTATMEEIQKAYRRKIMQYHPDRVEALGPEFKKLAESRTREINRAYETARRARG